METDQNKKHELTAEEYNALLQQVELKAISIRECSAKLRRDKLYGSADVSIKDKVSWSMEDENTILVDHSYELVAGSGAKKDYALKITCIFSLRYVSETALADGFTEIFTQRNVPLNTWPYFREFVQNMTQRMDLHTLTLPLLK